MGDLRRLSQHDDRAAERAVRLSAGLAWLFAGGHAVDIVLAVMAVELAWLVGRSGWRFGNALLRLGPGALMLLALRAALTGQEWIWVALPLMLSFPVHLADLMRR